MSDLPIVSRYSSGYNHDSPYILPTDLKETSPLIVSPDLLIFLNN